MMSLRALLIASAASVAMSQTTLTVDSSAFTYVSASDSDSSFVVGGAAVDATKWHRVSDDALTINVKIAATTTGTILLPSRSFISVASTHRRTTVASDVTVSNGVLVGDDVFFNVTFGSNAYGAYTVSFLCTSLTTTDGIAAAACPTVSGGATVSGNTMSQVVNIGFVPNVRILTSSGADVSSAWLDPFMTYSLVAGPGAAASFDATNTPDAPSFEGGALVSLVAPVTSTAITFSVSRLHELYSGLRYIVFPSGALKRADGVESVLVNSTVKLGFRPDIWFVDSSTGKNDSSAAAGGSAFWFASSYADIDLVITHNSNHTDATALFVTPGPSYGTSAGNLLAGMSSLPGSSSLAGGITSPSSSPTTTKLRYSLSTSGLAPGVYSFNIPAGVIQTSDGIYNCPLTASLKIGFSPRLEITDGAGADVTQTWLDPLAGETSVAYTTYKAKFSAGGSFGFLTAPATTLETLFTGDDASMFDFLSGSSATSGITYSLKFTASRLAGERTLTLPPGIVTRSDGIANAASNFSIKIGFIPSTFISDGSSTDSWYSRSADDVMLVINGTSSVVSTVASDNRHYALTTTTAPTFSATSLFKGLSAQFPSYSDIAVESSYASDNSFIFPLSLKTLVPGVYNFTIAAGAVCGTFTTDDIRGISATTTTTACSAPMNVSLQVGFTPEIQIFTKETYSNVSYNTPATGFHIVTDRWFSTSSDWGFLVSAGANTFDQDDIALMDTADLIPNSHFVHTCTASTSTVTRGWDFDYPGVVAPYGSQKFSSIKVEYPGGCLRAPGRYNLTIPSGTLSRSDGVKNAATSDYVYSGFDLDAVISQTVFGASADWVSPSNGEASLNLTSATTHYTSFYGDAPAFSLTDDDSSGVFGNNSALSATTPLGNISGYLKTPLSATSIVYGITFSSGALYPAGAYPINIPAGAVFVTGPNGVVGNAETTAMLQVGFSLKASFINVNGEEQSTFSPSADKYMAITLNGTSADLVASIAARVVPSAPPALASILSTASGVFFKSETTSPLMTSSNSSVYFIYKLDGVSSMPSYAYAYILSGTICSLSGICNAPSYAEYFQSANQVTATVMTGAANYNGSSNGDMPFDYNIAGFSGISILDNEVVVKFAATGFTGVGDLDYLTYDSASFADQPVPVTPAVTGSFSYTFKLTDVAQGAYDIWINENVLGSGNERRGVRLVIGANFKVTEYASSIASGVDVTRRVDSLAAPADRLGAFVTNSNELLVQIDIKLVSAATTFDELFDDVQDSNGESIKDAIVCLDDDSNTISCADSDANSRTGAEKPVFAISVAGLGDGEYSFILASSSALYTDRNSKSDLISATTPLVQTMKLVVDRKGPVGKNIVLNQTVYIGTNAVIDLPLDLFSDEFSDAHGLSLSSDDWIAGLQLDNNDLLSFDNMTSLHDGVLTTGPLFVEGPEGDAVFEIFAKDEAGNPSLKAATVSVKVVSPVFCSLSVVDSRGVASSTLLKTAPAADGTVALTVNAAFAPQAVGPLVASDILLSVNGSAIYPRSVSISPSDGVSKSRRFSFSVVISAEDAKRVRSASHPLDISVDTSSAVSAKGAPALSPEPVSVVVDFATPVTTDTYIAPLTAVVGVKYSTFLPMSLFFDGVSDNSDLKVTAASPSTQNGLSLSLGALGVASVSGTLTTVPAAATHLYFDVTVADEAGNKITKKNAVAIPVATRPTNPAAALRVSTTPLVFREDATSNTVDVVDAAATFVYTGTVKAIIVKLIKPDLSTDGGIGGAGTGVETLTTDSVDFSAACSSSVFDCKASYVSTDSDSYVLGVYSSTSISASDVLTYLKTVSYNNTRSNVYKDTRTILIQILGGNNDVIASAERSLSVIGSNSAPVVETTATSIVFTEGGSAVKVFTTVAISDADDTSMTAAYVQLALTKTTTTGACDKTRDVLSVNYPLSLRDEIGQPLFASIYDSASCTLTLTPQFPAKSLSKALFALALSEVVYKNTDAKNAGNFLTGTDLVRSVSVTVADAYSSNTNAFSTVSRSAPEVSTFTISVTDNAPVFNYTAAYGEGGLLAGTDDNANIHAFLQDGELFNVPTFTARVELELEEDKDVKFTFSNEALKAAIIDSDTNAIVSASLMTIKFLSTANTYIDIASISSLPTGYPVITGYEWNPSRTDDSSLTLTISKDPQVAQLEMITFQFCYASVCANFYVDIRLDACTLEEATNDVDNEDGHYYPAPSVCTFEPKTIEASGSEPVSVGRGDFNATFSDLADKAESLAQSGASIEEQIEALAPLRAAARGSGNLKIVPSSILGSGSIAVNMVGASATAAASLASLPLNKGELPLDTSLGFVLSPAGTQFSEPVQVCLFVGDTTDGYFRVLKTATEIDPSNPDKGYNEFETLSNQVFNPATGLVCGDTTHFSFVGAIEVALPATPVVPKSHVMGGSCPNACSGKGFCRSEGQCKCFAGFMGYDCSLRTCPSASSWGEEGVAPHDISECSGRGVCDRSAGLCACFDGYEGGACERLTCPNSCSGHGTCRFISELPELEKIGYSSWEAKRVQKCQCDGGYMGADCSQRICPFGDDPETICAYTARQVQTITVAYPNVADVSAVDDSNEFSLYFNSKNGQVLSTPKIAAFWDDEGADNMKSALESLPQFSVSEVDVSSTVSAAGVAPSVTYKVTFTGSTNTGNEELLQCPFNSDGVTMGCSAAGCQPKFKQPRLLSSNLLTAAAQGRGISISPLAVLLQPAAVEGGNQYGDDGEWGVSTSFVLEAAADGSLTYSFVDTKIWGSSSDELNIAAAPVPPSGLRGSIAGPAGLIMSLDTSDTVLSLGVGTYPISWTLPSCTVSVSSAADKDLEKAECSNRGVCDRTSGSCQCFNGYSGASCTSQVIFV